MVRKAEPINILAAKGKSHKTKAEIKARQEAEAALVFKTDKIEPPKWLKAAAKREFIALAAELCELRLMTNADVNMLAMGVDACVRYPKEHDPKIKKQLFDQWTKVAAEFGFTPSARAKIAMPRKEKPEPTAFEKRFGDRV